MKRFNKLILQILIIVFVMSNIIIANPEISLAKNNDISHKEKVSYEERGKVEILVKYKAESKSKNKKESSLMSKSININNEIKKDYKLSKLETKKSFKKNKIDLLEIDKDADVTNIVNEFRNNPEVEYAQPNYKLEIASIPSDPRFDEQWGLLNTGQEVEGIMGRLGVDINTTNAWDLTTGSDTVVVGILDTGIDITHSDLADNIYVNSEEIPDDGIDNDGNGFIDDVHGWNFADGNNEIYSSKEDDKHGTQIAGVIGALANDEGITGVAPNVKILPLKFISGDSGYTSDAIEAINYAMEMGVKVINCSFSGYDDNPALKDAMENSGILFVTAAGNRGGDIAEYPVYPAGFDIPNIFSVASIDSSGIRMPYSSFGEMIHVAAPGENILSTTPNNAYEYINGTSASAGLVTGVVALTKSYLPDLTYLEIVERIKSNVVVCAALENKVKTGGRVDAYATLTNTPPQPDDYVDPDGEDPVDPLEPEDLDSWFTADQLSKIKEMLHYGESGVNPATGNFSVMVNDMSVPALGFNINISRTYNSKNDTIGLLGRGWTFGFEGYLSGNDIITVELPNGSIQMFKKNGSTYTPLDSRSCLVKNSDNTYTLTTKDQYSYGFNSSGYLSWMKDRNSNTIHINYDSNNKIESITDTVGRQYTLHYTSQNLIDYITGPEDMRIDYTYDSNKCLITVKDAEDGLMKYFYDSYYYLNRIDDHYDRTIENVVYSHSSGVSQHKVTQATDAYGCINNLPILMGKQP